MANGSGAVAGTIPAGRDARAARGERPSTDGDPVESVILLESKLARPAVPARTVPRKAVLAALRKSGGVPYVAIVAPSGFGKTTVAAQWAARDRRPFAWLSLHRGDDDLGVLLPYLAAGLASVCPTLRTGGVTVTRLAAAVRRARQPFVLVIDNAHLLRDPDCVEAILVVGDSLGAGSQILALGRGSLALPMAQLRADARVAELGPRDLTMTPGEAEALLGNMDAGVTPREADEVRELTEGWPAALHLAGLTLREDRFDRRSTIRHLRQTESVVDYLRSEFLADLTRSQLAFLTRTSVLRTISGPVCDAVLGRTGSARVLEDLGRRNMLLVPLDQHGERYRYHRLLRRYLRAELERKEPGRAADLLRRAAGWYEEQGRIEEALDHARELGDPDLAARLLVRHATRLHRHGGDRTLVPWFDWFAERDLLERYPAVAASGAWLHASLGRAATAQRWTEAAERGLPSLPEAERAGVDGVLYVVRAAQGRGGPRRMELDAERAMGLLPERSGARSAGLVLQAVARRMQDAGQAADPLFVEAFEHAMDQRAYPAAVVALAERARLAAEQDDWLAAGDLVRRAMMIVREAGLDDDAVAVLVYAMGARVAAHEGDLPAAKQHVGRAQGLRGDVTHAIPFLAVEVRLELARAYLALTDSAGARSMLRELESLFALRDLGVLRRDADDVHAQVSSIRATFVGGSSLTTAELRLLPLLATHYSFREIADRLYVSRHTVKTQAISIYRKLRVTSRSEAVEAARRNGLLAASAGGLRDVPGFIPMG
ncbi:MAG TPA: LuxR C-terminal-related transcriptional regulator [Actinomycetota bacterium]|jgi:LuxR family maltose regulon positive regulatory protein